MVSRIGAVGAIPWLKRNLLVVFQHGGSNGFCCDGAKPIPMVLRP